MYYVLWIVNPLLELILLTRLIRKRIAPQVSVFKLYLFLWPVADIYMAIIWRDEYFRWYSTLTIYALFYILRLLVAVSCCNAIRAWTPAARYIMSWILGLSLTILAAFSINTTNWQVWEHFSAWADIAIWFMCLIYLIWETRKVWPYRQIIVGMSMTVLLNAGLQWMQGDANPRPWMRVAYQATNTVGLIYWLLTIRRKTWWRSLQQVNHTNEYWGVEA